MPNVEWWFLSRNHQLAGCHVIQVGSDLLVSPKLLIQGTTTVGNH
jgi:hypothetical protein